MENGDKIVNGKSGRERPREKAWIGEAWSINWNTTGEPLPEDQQKKAITGGALWPYCKNIKSYRCPTSFRGELQSYAIFDAMNGAPRPGTINETTGTSIRVGRTVLWVRKLSEIISPGPAQRAVFIDEGRTTPGSYAVRYETENWHDPPMLRHGNGTTLSFADGHVEYYKFTDPRTLEAGRFELEFKWPQYTEKNQPDNEDLQFIQKACWGRLHRE